MMPKRIDNLIKNRRFRQLLTCSVLVVVALILVYWMRVFYYFDYASAPLMIAVSLAITFGVYFFLRFITLRIQRNFPLYGALLVLFCGLLFAFANAPVQTPDEHTHFLRSYAISCGHFDFDPAREYPNDVELLLEEFSPFYSHFNSGEDEQIIYRYERYFDRLAKGDIASTEFANEPILMLILPYLPSALVIAPLRALGVNALVLLFVARAVNVVVFAALCYYALKIADRFRVLLLGMMLFPTTLYIAASLSYDSAMLAMSLVLLAFAFKKEITTRDIIIICIMTGYISHIKILNIMLIIPVIAILKSRWSTKVSRWFFILLASVSAFIGSVAVTSYAAAFSYFEPIPRLESVDPVGQIFFILSNIPRYCMVLLGTFYENDLFLSDLSNFGWTDTPVPLVSYFALPIMLFVAVFFCEFKKGDTPMMIVMFGVFIAYSLAAITGLYITNTPVGMVRVVGTQARYFLPGIYAALLSLTLFSGKFLQVKSAVKEHHAVAMLGGYSAVSAILLFLTHNIMW